MGGARSEVGGHPVGRGDTYFTLGGPQEHPVEQEGPPIGTQGTPSCLGGGLWGTH